MRMPASITEATQRTARASPPAASDAAPPPPLLPPPPLPPASLALLPIFSPPRWAFLVSYPNMRLTVPTLLAWLACIMFHYACTLCVFASLAPSALLQHCRSLLPSSALLPTPTHPWQPHP